MTYDWPWQPYSQPWAEIQPSKKKKQAYPTGYKHGMGLTCVTAGVGTLPATDTLPSSIGVALLVSSTD